MRATGALRIAFVVLLTAPEAAAQTPSTASEIYGAWCARCHAQDGSGRVENPTVKTQPMDFTNCRITSPEPEADWALVTARGGPAAGLSSEMPAFGDALAADQIDALVDLIRSFCRDPGWPPGNLNFPRPLFTEKAFPEDEVIIRPALSHHDVNGLTEWRVQSIYERRIGKRAHAEVSLPLVTETRHGVRASGVGDVSVAGKVALFWNRDATQIVSAALEVTLPTGSELRGLGNGTPVFEPYLAYGALVGDLYLQTQLKLELPGRAPWLYRELVYNVYVGRDTSVLPSTWTVGVELNGANREVAVTPQLRKGLTRTGALAAAVGVRIPITAREEQAIRWVGYLLWEYLEPVRPRR